MKGIPEFCDLLCIYARIPTETAMDGSGSCRTFVALHCELKKSLVHKNMAFSKRVSRKKARNNCPAGPYQPPFLSSKYRAVISTSVAILSVRASIVVNFISSLILL